MEYTVSEFGEVIIRKRSRKERGILSNMIKVTYQERLRNKLNCYLTEKALQAEATVNLISQASYSRNNILFGHEWKVLNKENLNNEVMKVQYTELFGQASTKTLAFTMRERKQLKF